MTAPKRSRGGLVVVTDLPMLDGLPDVVQHTAHDYLAGEGGTDAEGLTVINLCRSYQYLSRGYYVSLLADARRQRVVPTLETIQAITDPYVYFRALQEAGLDTIDYRIVRGGHRLLPRLIIPEHDLAMRDDADRPLAQSQAEGAGLRYEDVTQAYREITSVLGRTSEPQFRRVCATIYRAYPIPLLKIRLYENPEEETWQVGQLYPIPVDRLDPSELDLLRAELGKDRLRREPPESNTERPYRIACLFDDRDPHAPSDEGTLDRFERAAAKHNALFEVIGKQDLGTLAEYDALFIRTVTAIDHYSFTFARTAESLGIPVIDDPRSIIRCTNKVFLHELFQKQGIPTPRTVIISRKTPADDIAPLGFPLILKMPDGTFSDAVKKAEGPEEFEEICQEMFRRSPLLIVQEFTPTPFDWRIGVLDRRLLFAAKYHMVKDHWQIVGRWKTGRRRFGRVEAVPNDAAPTAVTTLAVEAADLIGDGLYGVDIKESPNGPLVIEVNDNPNLVETDEDAVERDRLYDAVIQTLLRRIKAPQGPPTT